MDPATIALIFGAAKTAYSAIQQGIKIGKDIQAMSSDIAKLYGSLAKLTQAAADPPRPKIFSKVTAEEIAIDIVQKRKQAAEWAQKAKNQFIEVYGLNAWDEVLREIIRVRKEQRRIEEQRQREREQLVQDLMLLGSVALVAVFLIASVLLLSFLMYR